MRKLIILFLLLMLASTSFSQTNPQRNEVLKKIVNTLNDLGFTDYTEHFQENYIVTNIDNEYAQKNTEIGFDNLISICLQSEKEDWDEIIRDHFSQMKNIRKEMSALTPKIEDYETAIKYLKVRLYPIDYLNVREENSVFIKNKLGFLEVVVIDYPSTVANLTKDYLTKWNITTEDLIPIVADATIDSNAEQLKKLDFKAGAKIHLFSSKSNIFITTNILDLKKKNIPVGKFGTYVSVPNRINMPILTLEDKKTFYELTMHFMLLTEYMFDEGPASISSNFFWYDGDDLYLVENDTSNNKLKLPDKLTKMIQ